MSRKLLDASGLAVRPAVAQPQHTPQRTCVLPFLPPRRLIYLQGPLGVQLGLFDGPRRGRPRTAEKFHGIRLDTSGQRTRVADGLYVSLCGSEGVIAIEIAKQHPKIEKLRPVAITQGFIEGEQLLVRMVQGRNPALELVSALLRESGEQWKRSS